MTPGTSALFILNSAAVLDSVRAELAGTEAELIPTHLSTEDEARLRETFSEEA